MGHSSDLMSAITGDFSPSRKCSRTTATQFLRDPSTFPDVFSHATSLGWEDHPCVWNYQTKARREEHFECVRSVVERAEAHDEWSKLRGVGWEEELVHRVAASEKNSLEKS